MLRTQAPAAAPFALACPTCRSALDGTRCPGCDCEYSCEGGIWRLLPPTRAQAYTRFEQQYLAVRRHEGWGSSESRYYRALPFEDLSGRFPEVWRIRAASFRVLLREVDSAHRLRILDLGAGNCWLSYQLAKRGHRVAAIDVQVDEHDGLGAHKHYDEPFTPMQAEFDRLPLQDGQADVAIFNGSLHYSTDLERTLAEALRVLDHRGTIGILDSPMYPNAASGRQMVLEREAHFQRTYGFVSDALPSEHFLTPRRLAELGRGLGVHWRVIKPWHGWRRAVLPWRAWIKGLRAPASFPVIIGKRA